MAVIGSVQFIAIADRLARQAITLEDAVNFNTSGVDYYTSIHGPLPFAGDFEVESDLIVPMNTTDLAMNFDNISVTFFATAINALNSHVTGRGGAPVTDLDDYLDVSGIRVHELYGVVYEDVVGAALDAKHVFRDDEIEMAVVTFTSSGVGTFTDANRLGDGAGGDFVRDTFTAGVTPNSANANLKWHVASGLGATDVILSVIGIDSDGDSLFVNFTIPSGTGAGTELGFGATAEKFADVTTVQLAGGDLGAVVTIRSIVERSPSLYGAAALDPCP